MCHQFNSKELEVFHEIKAVFDPQSLLNPGKAVPELHRCAELGVFIRSAPILGGVICRDAHALHPTQHNGAIQVRPYQD
jgi:hypothetical protein